MYFELPMIHSTRYLRCPHYGYRQIVQITPFKVLAEAANWMQQADDSALVHRIHVQSGFLKDSRRTQFIDFDNHPFMRDADFS
jgi:hypothetical protein